MILRSRRVVLPDSVRPASIHIEGGRIVRIDADVLANASAVTVNDFGDLIVAPGLVDTHVHVNEPGRTEWEGFDTATRAAAAGGVTTIVDMPLNAVPATTTVAALEAKRASARGRSHVDVAFWGGVVPGNADHIAPLVDAGVVGFKCFLAPSGVDEFPAVAESDLRAALPILARRHVPLLVHAESPAYLLVAEEATRYAEYLATRPPAAERAAVRLMTDLAREFGVHVHIVHVASAEAVDAIASARSEGVRVTAETCPHYLTFDAHAIPDGATEFKCAPPIRAARHRTALWNALDRGTLDMIVTDHSPAPPVMKPKGNFMRSWGGIASLELSLSAVWTACREMEEARSRDGARARTLGRLFAWMSAAPARLAGLDDRKGRIAPGFDADLVIWDPDAEKTVDPESMQQRHKVTPYARRTLRGRVAATFVRGVRVWNDGVLAQPGTGALL